MRTTRNLIWTFGLLLTLASVCNAQHFAGMLRDELALGLTPTTASWGMGGAYVGVPGARSMNPAALAFVDSMQVSAQGIMWNPDLGPDVSGIRVDAIVPFLFEGHSRFMGFYYGSDGADGIDTGGGAILDADFESATLGLQFGIPITENLAFGLGGYPYERAEVEIYAENTNTELVHGEAFSQIGSIQAGLQWRANETVTLGVEGIYIIDELEAGGAALPFDVADDYYIHYVAIGGSWQPFEKTLVAVDFRFGEIEGAALGFPDNKFDQDVERWNFGIEQQVLDTVALRLGSSNGGVTAGASVDLMERFTVEYAYVDQALHDVDSLFNDIVLHTIGVTCRF